MNWHGSEGGVVARIVASAIAGPGFVAIQAATLQVAIVLARMLNEGLAQDFEKLKRDLLTRSRAKTRESLARAVRAENEANLLKKNDRISRAEERVKLAEAAKISAEASAILAKIESEQKKAKDEAVERLFAAVVSFNADGGGIGLDGGVLRQLIKSLRNTPIVADSLDATPQPIVIVGHSAGGVVAGGASASVQASTSKPESPTSIPEA